MEPLASASGTQVAAWVGPTIEAYATGRLGAALGERAARRSGQGRR